jgi:hypothetical protein
MKSQSQAGDPFRYRIAVLGNPETPEARFDDAQLARLKELGFNMVQLNIAWGSRPPGEPLNLEDVLPLPGRSEAPAVARCREELRRRARQCKKFGLRTLFHFGAPHVKDLYRAFEEQGLEHSQKVDACLLLPETPQLYHDLVTRLAEACPEIDDLLVYTYDQEAWLCGEFGECPRCKGVPLHERLPAFLHVLRDAWAAGRAEGTVWWEPWELSAGQTLMMASRVPDRNFGLMLHANIAEAQVAHPVDPWFRNMTRACAHRGLPVIGEVFLSATSEEIQPFTVPVPRLVWQELAALRSVEGVVGVKEYFGLLPDRADPNLEMAAQVFATPSVRPDAALAAVAAAYGDAADDMLRAWEASADAVAMFPWDVCWKLRHIGVRPAWHDWQGYRLPGHLVDSPSWCSTRRALFMTTENDDLHPWFYEDMGLRCGLSAQRLDEAAGAATAALPRVPQALREAAAGWLRDMGGLRQSVRSYHCHIMETLAAQHIRDAVAAGREVAPGLVERLRALLTLDVQNQADAPPAPPEVVPASAMLAAFEKDPRRWAQEHLRF